ncbi:MAG: hypothetical protein GY928_25950 [Colwellia sp.]|nr:hypothetical protein [Colwellia sp.]
MSAFIKERDDADEGNAITGMDIRVQRDDIVLFAHDLSEKYDALVSVELVDTMIIAFYDSTNHHSRARAEELHVGGVKIVEQKHLDFLDALRQTSSVDLFGAKIPLKNKFKYLDEFQAKCIISYWMNNYDNKGTKVPTEKKDDILDHIDDGIDLDGDE